MATLTIPYVADTPGTWKFHPPLVYCDGRRRRDLYAVKIDLGEAPRFGSAELRLNTNRLRGAADLLPPIGARVEVRTAESPGETIFNGVVTEHETRHGDAGPQYFAHVEHVLGELLSVPIQSRWCVQDGKVLQLLGEQVIFNDGPEAMAGEALSCVNGRSVRLFETSVSARRWTVADALAYLIATNLPADVEATGLLELERLAGLIDLGRLDVSGESALDAMLKVADRGGLKLRSARGGTGLVVYRPGRDGPARAVDLQPAGSKITVPMSNLWHHGLRVQRRPSRPTVIALGEHRRHESTFTLARGWDPSLQTTRWRDFVRSAAENWPVVADVFRKWVLNEHGRYCNAPWNLPAHDFGSIEAGDFLLRRQRRFLPCLSCDKTGHSLGVVVQFRLDEAAEWQRWTGPVWISRDQCAVHLGGDALPAEYFEAAVAGSVQVRVTATVAADTRIAAQITGDPAAPRRVVDFSDRAAWRKVHATSIFHDAPDLGEPAERDDETLLVSLAQRWAEVRSTAVEARLELAWVDESWHVGDIVEQVEGRAVQFSSNPDAAAAVTAVQHLLDERHSTILHVTG